ncbi:MAG: ATP-dependent DNA helicase RecG [Veillonellaceae bacterium]|nr:ATP-dependent DNA helicase RecG [Veillonellaceae bacterium]
MSIQTTDAVTVIKGIGPRAAQRLAVLGIRTVGDLLMHFPRSYIDYSVQLPLRELREGMDVTVGGRILAVEERRPRARLSILTVTISDDTGLAELVYFNQPFRRKLFREGERVVASGKVKAGYRQWQIANAEVEFPAPGERVRGRIRPVYPLTEGLRAGALEEWISRALTATADPDDTLPAELRARLGFSSRRESLRKIHRPTTVAEYEAARHELAFDELFYLQLGVLRLRRRREQGTQGIKCAPNGELTAALYRRLPYRLTGDQLRALQDICDDMESLLPMRRLLQGDVGSGKTAVAALAMAKAVENGYQAVLMAPTEILAKQHEESLREMFAGLPVRIDCLTGRLPAAEREEVLARLRRHETDLVVGTHALFGDEVELPALGLVITDEQHRFGVRQRMALEQKGQLPHTLVMTATPIPRTLTLSVYGDLDVSLIREMPPGRKPVGTYVARRAKMPKILRFIEQEMAKGQRVYLVCPLVEESEKMDLKAAQQVYAEMSEHFAAYGAGLVYGSMASAAKEAVMADFASGRIRLLVATSVVEVGVNVPEATVMLIDSAERFGLSQLHQLRGRVGRGTAQSYCILISDTRNEVALQRLHYMETIQDGFLLAEKDLLLRGSGELFGYRQHGLPDLHIADLVRDLPLLVEARREAAHYVDSPAPYLQKELERRFGAEFLELLYH